MLRKFGMAMAIACISTLITYSSVMAEADDIKKTLENAGMDDKISYAIGYDVGSSIQSVIKINPDLLSQGIKDSLTGKPGMTDEELQEAMKAFQGLARQKQMEAMGKKITENKAAGKAFLADNKTKEGVIELDSGLQYKVIKTGDGALPKPEDTVECHYRGTLIDGREFDSSYSRNQPAVFPVSGVIKGWTQALQLMNVGSKWMLYVPSELAYGDRGAGDRIEPGSTLVFEVELLSIQ